MHISYAAGLLLLVVASDALAQPEIHWKTRLYGRGVIIDRQPSANATTDRRHWVVQFAAAPTAADLDSLRLRGARVVSPAPEWGFVISGDESTDLSGLNLAHVEPIAAAEKLSPELNPKLTGPRRRAAAKSGRYVVEFHSDVEPASAREVLLSAQVRVVDHPQLLNQHYVVEATSEGLHRLQAWDEIAYVFPASDELLNGVPVTACYGAVTGNGTVGQSIALVGPGWAAATGGATRLNYALGALSGKIDPLILRAEVRRALDEWSKHLQVDFTEINQLNAIRTLAFRWGRGISGGPIPFDGPGKMLAYTYYPAPPNPEPTAGDLYFDDDENWQVGNDVDLYSVVLHEIGHALGLGHSDLPGSVMYPYYRKASSLTEEDIAAARNLYAARIVVSETPARLTPTQPQNPATAAPAPDDTASPTTPAPANDRTPPLLAITSPMAVTILTTQASIRVTGTALDDSGVTQVTWSTPSASGTAEGTPQWSADIPLMRGINTINIQASDRAGNSRWRSLVVTRR